MSPYWPEFADCRSTVGRAEINIQIKELIIPNTFVVVDGLCPNLLVGTDFLSKNHALVNYKDHSVSFK